jgi:catechol 2,3-dioxygenase-like lactoylglutathione lyase family enzyme
MKFHSSVIFVSDIEKSKDFYTRLIGLKIEHDFGANIIFEDGLTIWQVLEQHVINKNLITKGDLNQFELYFETKNLDRIHAMLKEEGVTFLHEIHEEPWGQRSIRFFDPDNHLLEVGEPLEVFINNMYNNGLSLEQVAEKSGVPLETVMALVGKD